MSKHAKCNSPTYDKRIAEIENVMRLQTDVIADLNKQITGLRADNATLVQEIQSYRDDYQRMVLEMEAESGGKR